MTFINKKYIIGIDIGGSKIIAALVKGAQIFHKIKIPMPKNKKDFFDKLEKVIGELIKKAGGKKNIRGIGCGIGGALDLEKGIILSWSNIKFLDKLNIKSWLKKQFNYEVRIDNDAKCFIRAEYLFGAGKGYNNIVGMTLGTGVGGGIIIGGKMIYGANDSAGEIGHMIINNGKDLEETTVKQMRKLKFSKIAAKEFEKNLGIGLANIINILDPEIIIIGGGAAKTVEAFILKARKIAEKFIVSPQAEKNVKILKGKLGENAGAIGAAALFYSQNI
ncbi:MAG: Transcriptional regulator [Candidatus Yanofskybacteria bacterium GW2011_GWC2_41_9]|uniref:Transcriptional regulator n=1 Tax=Candidatus Yanofskybacteria bacterium GW2011_GWC2_41_9 TaxID=1619029 RepID=A0A0G0XK25_9BACT|nr:MAG: Transcriptional regulator [Candidatus Yanofskybacteria bacterium GW2011_GWC2_41_9]